MSLDDDNGKKLYQERAYYNSKLGNLAVYASKFGVTKIEFAGEIVKEEHVYESGSLLQTDEVTNPSNNPVSRHIAVCMRWLHQYFSDPSKIGDVEVPRLDVSPHQSRQFLVKVWQILRARTQPGQTVTYGKLAAMAGNSKAGRSVGLAMRRNPFPIVVPCHRVIKSNAKIGHYSGLNGTETKKWLLDHEKAFCSKKIDTIP